MKRINLASVLTFAALGCSLTLTGCGSSGSSTPAATNSDGEVLSSLTTGYTVPSDISAVPEETTNVSASVAGFAAAVRSMSRAAAALDATSDYALAIPSKYIEEPVLDQFDIIEQVLGAINQTHFADDANINNGPYKSMIAWTDEQEGKEIKTLQPWTIDSRMVVIDGVDVNRVLCWIEENDQGVAKTIKAEFKVYAGATFDSDGEVADYGTWDLNVKFDDSGDNFFAASAEPDGNGGTIIKINEYENYGGGDEHSLKGVLHRSNTSGYGKMAYTDWDAVDWQACGNDCSPGVSTAQYAYNNGYLGVQKNSDAVTYKDRSVKVDMTHRYGLFYDENNAYAGDNVIKHKQFGFPVTYTDPNNGGREYAYYGAWQGRHQLWGGGQSGVPAGTTVTKESWGANSTAVTYTVADAINGSFTKRTYVDADLTDIKNIPVETWIDKGYDLFYNLAGDEWRYCENGWMDWSGPTCMDFATGNPKAMTAFTNYDSLVVGENDRKWVNINHCDGGGCTDYVYLNATNGPSSQATYTVPGFYEAQRDQQTGQLTAVAGQGVVSFNDNDGMWASLGGSIYIAYDGDFTGGQTGWVQKELVSFNDRNYQPVFGDGSNDTTFSPEMGREYYMNSNGVNYVVKRKDSADAAASYEVFLEIQKTANPANCTVADCSTIVPAAVSYFRTPWEPNKRFVLETDSGDPNYLLVVYQNDDQNTPDDDTGTVYAQGMWGLQAWNDNGTAGNYADDFPLDASGNQVNVDEWGFPDVVGGETDRPLEFNWEYCNPDNGNCWGAQTYLKDADLNYVILSDPIQLNAITATNGAAQTKTLMLQYDGWMHGLPDLYDDLRQNDWTITQDLKDKIINIPAATAVSDGTNGYYLKPMQTSVFLETVTAVAITGAGGTVPDVTLADDIDLTTDVPSFVEHNMGDLPTGTTIKYSEGVLVE